MKFGKIFFYLERFLLVAHRYTPKLIHLIHSFSSSGIAINDWISNQIDAQQHANFRRTLKMQLITPFST